MQWMNSTLAPNHVAYDACRDRESMFGINCNLNFEGLPDKLATRLSRVSLQAEAWRSNATNLG